MPGLHLVAKALDDLDLLDEVKTAGILHFQKRSKQWLLDHERQLRDLQNRCESLWKRANEIRGVKRELSGQHALIHAIGFALSGDLELHLPSGASEEVSAAALNAAAADTFKRWFAVVLQTAGEKPHLWATFEPVLTPAEIVTDPDVSAPSIPADLALDRGRLLIEVTFDTDAGVTKTYAVDDEVSVDVQVAADDKLFGWSVTKATKTYNVVA